MICHRFLLLGTLAIFLGSSASVEAESTAAGVLASFQKASGGDAWRGIHTLHIKASLASGGVQFHADRWEDVATGRYRVRDVAQNRFSQEGFDGVTHWQEGGTGTAPGRRRWRRARS